MDMHNIVRDPSAHGEVREMLLKEFTGPLGALQDAGAGPQYLCSLAVNEEEWIRSDVEVLVSEGVLWAKNIKIGVPRGREKRRKGLLPRKVNLCAGTPMPT